MILGIRTLTDLWEGLRQFLRSVGVELQACCCSRRLGRRSGKGPLGLQARGAHEPWDIDVASTRPEDGTIWDAPHGMGIVRHPGLSRWDLPDGGGGGWDLPDGEVSPMPPAIESDFGEDRFPKQQWLGARYHAGDGERPETEHAKPMMNPAEWNPMAGLMALYTTRPSDTTRTHDIAQPCADSGDAASGGSGRSPPPQVHSHLFGYS